MLIDYELVGACSTDETVSWFIFGNIARCKLSSLDSKVISTARIRVDERNRIPIWTPVDLLLVGTMLEAYHDNRVDRSVLEVNREEN